MSLGLSVASALALATTSAPSAGRPDALAGLAVHHVQISVRDADTLAGWYVGTLGFRVTKRVAAGSVKIVWIDIPGFRLGLAQIAGSVRPPSQSAVPSADGLVQGYRQIHFSVASVDAAYRLLVGKGVHFAVVPTSFAITGIRLATLCDPEGNVISLYQDIDAANPPVGNQMHSVSGDVK